MKNTKDETKIIMDKDYLETHYEMVSEIERIYRLDEPYGRVRSMTEEFGFGGLYSLAKELTDEFQTMYQDVQWGIDLDDKGEELEWLDTLEEFCNEKLR